MLRPLHSAIDTLETEYFSIMDDLSFKRVAGLELAFKFMPKPLFAVKKENKGSSKSKFNNEYFAHSKYSFYDENLNPYKVFKKGWELININEPEIRDRLVFYEISDPKGDVKEISNKSLNAANWSEYFQIEGICNIIRLLEELSNYPDWSYFELIKRNLELKRENNRLLVKINELEKKINKQ